MSRQTPRLLKVCSVQLQLLSFAHEIRNLRIKHVPVGFLYILIVFRRIKDLSSKFFHRLCTNFESGKR